MNSFPGGRRMRHARAEAAEDHDELAAREEDWLLLSEHIEAATF